MIGLTITFLVLTIYAIVQENLSLFGIEPSKILSLKILDTSSAATLFVTLLGALVVRHQFVVSLRPRLSYSSKITKSDNVDSNGDHCKVWQVSIRNAGLGAAIITSIQFKFANKTEKENSKLLSNEELVKELEKHDLILDQDYWLEFISSGFTLAPEKDCCLFEIRIEHFSKIKHLEAIVFFQGFLGERYSRDIAFSPPEVGKRKIS